MALRPVKRKCLDIKKDSEKSSPFDFIPNEILEITIKMVMKNMNTQEKYNFLTEVLPKVSRRFKAIANDKPMWKGVSPFEKLPDSLAEIPLRMVLTSVHLHRRSQYLVEELAKVSSRFKALASLKSLWTGHVVIMGDPDHKKKVIRHYVNNGTTNITLSAIGRPPGKLKPQDLITLAAKCPNLNELTFRVMTMDFWPDFASPWTSLKKLSIFYALPDFVALGYAANPELFANIELHRSLPHLEELTIRACGNFDLPEMEWCHKLHTIRLGQGHYCIASVPFGLKRLCSMKFLRRVGVDDDPCIYIERKKLEVQLEDCSISDNIQFVWDCGRSIIEKN